MLIIKYFSNYPSIYKIPPNICQETYQSPSYSKLYDQKFFPTCIFDDYFA